MPPTQRERELAEGHAAIRYAAYVTVSAPNTGPGAVDELEAAVSRVELEAKRAPLRLERMWGQQAEAFTYSLPLGGAQMSWRARRERRLDERAARRAARPATRVRQTRALAGRDVAAHAAAAPG